MSAVLYRKNRAAWVFTHQDGPAGAGLYYHARRHIYKVMFTVGTNYCDVWIGLLHGNAVVGVTAEVHAESLHLDSCVVDFRKTARTRKGKGTE